MGDLDLFCNKTEGHWADLKCRDQDALGALNWTLAISSANENTSIAVLRATISELLQQYPTTDEDDEALVLPSTIPVLTRHAVRTRLREKQLLRHSLEVLDTRQQQLDEMTFQGTEQHMQGEKRRLENERHSKEQAEFREHIARLRERQYRPQPVIEFPVKLGKGRSDVLRVLEGEDLDEAISSFVT